MTNMLAPARVWAARVSLEHLATQCIQGAIAAVLITSGQDATLLTSEAIGQLAVGIAFAVRKETDERLMPMLASEEGRAMLERISLEEAKKTGKGAL